MQDSVQSLSQAEVSNELFDEENSLGAGHNPPLYYYKSGAERRSLWLNNYQQQLNKEQISTIVESPILETKTNMNNSMNTNLHPENLTLPCDEMANVSGFEHQNSPKYEQEHENEIGISNLCSNLPTNHIQQSKLPQHSDQLEALKGADSPVTYFIDLHPQTSMNQDKSCWMEMGSLIRGTEQKMDMSLKINPSNKDRDSQHMHAMSGSNNNNISSQLINDQLKNTSNHFNKQTTTWQSQQLIEGRPSGPNFPRSETKKATISNINNGQWKKKGKNGLINIFNIGAVKQVIAHMRQHLILRKLENLSQSNIKLINDLSFPSKDQETSQDQIFLTRIFSMSPLTAVPVFQPDSLLFIVWSILVFFTILVQVFFIPLEVSFKVGLGRGDFFLGFVYVVEMLVSFNSGYFEEGIVVKDRVKIVLRYLRFQFWMDLTTSVAFFMNSDHDIFLLDVIFMIRIASIAILYKEIMQYFQFYRYQAFVDFITLLFWTILMAHYMGCGFHFVSNSGSGTWIELMHLQNSQWQERYVYSIYFSFVTMSTIGYGDIYPVSVSEKIYVIGMLVIGCGWFAYVINAAGQIFSEIQLKKKEIREKQFKILEYMRSRNVSKNLQLKIVKYLDFITTKESNSNSHGEKILESMSKDLREQVLRECYKPILKKHFLFRNYFSEQFLDKLIGHMKEAALGPGEQVFNQNDTEKVLFFIKEGKVDLMLASPITQESFLISTLQDDQFFGDNQFFQITHQNPYSAVCREQSSLVFLSLDDFIEVGHSFPKDMESYCHLKDKALWSRSIHDCEICRQGKHDFLKCPAVFYNPKELLFIYRLNKDTPQFERVVSQRSNYKGSNSLKDRQYIQRLARQFRMTLECIVQGKETEQKIDSNPQSAQKIEEVENKKNSIYIPMDKILEDADSRTDTQSYQQNGSKSNKKTPQSKGREPIQPKKSLLCRTYNSDGGENHVRNNPRTMKKMQFPRDLIEEGNDKDFFKGCIQLEFLEGEWQQCSEFESDSAEEDTEEEWKEGSINGTETHENIWELEKDQGKQQQYDKQQIANQKQLQNQQIQQLGQELQQDEKSQNSPVRINPISKNTYKKPSPNAEIIPEESYSVLLNETDISPQPQLPEISHRQAPHNASLGSLQPSNSSKFTHKGYNNEQMSLSGIPDVEQSPQQNLQKHTQPSVDDTGQTSTKGPSTIFRRRQRLATRNLGDFMIQRAGKKRTYIESTQQLQSYEFGLGQVADAMQTSGGLGQDERRIMTNSSAYQYLNKFARNNNNNSNGKTSTNVGMMSASNLNTLLVPMDQSIASPEEQFRRQNSRNKLNLVVSINRQKSFQLHGNSPEEIPITNSNQNNLNFPVGSVILNQLQPQQLQGTTAGNNGMVSPLDGGGNLLIGGAPRKNGLNQIWRATTQLGMSYPGELPNTQQFSCLSKLDAMKKYKIYFPAFNHDSVLKNCRRINQNKLKSINQQKKNKKQLPNLRDQGLGNLQQSQSMFKTIKTNNNHGTNKNESSFSSNNNGNFNSNNNGNMQVTRGKQKSNTAKISRSMINAENYNQQIYPKSGLNQLEYQ